MDGSIGNTPPVTPQGTVDHRMRAPGSGYAGGPTATSAKGPPQDLNAGHVDAPKPPPKTPPQSPIKGRFINQNF